MESLLAKKLIVLFLIDASDSMRGTKIGTVNQTNVHATFLKDFTGNSSRVVTTHTPETLKRFIMFEDMD